MGSDVMDKCYKMVGAFFSRVTSSNSRRRDTNPQVVDVIRAVPHNGVPTKEAEATGAYKAGVWVWDAPPHQGARTSPRAAHRSHKQGAESDSVRKDSRKYHSMGRTVRHTYSEPQPQPQSQLSCCQRDASPHHSQHPVTSTSPPTSATPSLSLSPSSSTTPLLLDNDVKHASLSRKPEPPPATNRTPACSASAASSSEKTENKYMTLPSEKTENKYMTLPHVTSSSPASAKSPRAGSTRLAQSTVTRNPCAEMDSKSIPRIPRPPQSRRRTWRDEEVKRLAKSMVCSIETLMESLHGIVGDLRELVHQIDAVTDSMDIPGSPSPAAFTHIPRSSESTTERNSSPSASKTTCTQTELDRQQQQHQQQQHWHPSLSRNDYLRKCDRVQAGQSHNRYSYPQYYCHSPVSNASPSTSPSGFDTDRGMYRVSTASSMRRPADGGSHLHHPVQRVAKSSSPQQHHQQRSYHLQSEMRQDQLSKRRQQQQQQLESSGHQQQQRPRALSSSGGGASGGAPQFMDSLIPSLMPSMCGHSPEPSMPFIPVESPPNPAPTLFSAYREDGDGAGGGQAKDSDSLPDRSLKTWKEKMERHGGSADSLTPQMDWSYLVLTDQHHCATIVECCSQSEIGEGKEDQFTNKHSLDRASLPRDWGGMKGVAGGLSTSEGRRAQQKDRTRLPQAGSKVKQHAGAITRIPEHGEPPCEESSYDENCEVFTFTQTCSSSSSVSSSSASALVSQAANPSVVVSLVERSEGEPDSQNHPRIVTSENVGSMGVGVFPQVKQSIGGASLGWNAQSKALPNWPSAELSSIGASDSDLDELSSPFLPQHFQYPRRSSALDSTSDKNQPEVAEGKLKRAASVADTIVSEGFEVRTHEISPESDAQGTSSYAGQYENAMETRLEQMTNECSDFSDADADVGSDVLEQSLTSLEDPSSVKYDRELNTWTSYTMTHIDSDDVVSDSTSDILNENMFEVAPTNPGFDDVSLNFEDIGILPLPLQGSTVDKLSPTLE